MSDKQLELMNKNDNIDVVAAVLASAYILKTTDRFDFNNFDLYVNTYVNMKARLVNELTK